MSYVNDTMDRIREYARTLETLPVPARTLPTFAQTYAAVRLDWPDVTVEAAQDGGIYVESSDGRGAVVTPLGEVHMAQTR